MIEPKRCRYDPTILCGVLKNPQANCYVQEQRCKEQTVENHLALISETFGTITLKRYRYNLKKADERIIDSICPDCKIIWLDGKCLICKGKK